MAAWVDFTNEKEVKEYLNNLEIEYRFGCVKENNDDSCVRLGEFLATFRKKYREAANIYKKCCDTFQNAPCCYKTAEYHMFGRGGLEKSKLLAYKYYFTACKQDKYVEREKNARIASACCDMAGLLINEQDLRSEFMKNTLISDKTNSKTESEQIYSEVLHALKKSCSLNDKIGCSMLSNLYLQGFEGKKPNLELAATYADISCSLDHYQACHNLSIMYKRGDGVVKSEEKSKEYAEKRDELMGGRPTSLKFGAEY